jgi:hypothetical protein
VNVLEQLGRGVAEGKLPTPVTVEKALAALPEDSRNVVRSYVDCKARLEGNADLAGKLRPGAQPPDAATILRDLKRVEAALTPPSDGPIAFNLMLMPEGPPLSLRPGVKESLGKNLPELEKLPDAELAARKCVLGELRAAASLPWHRLNVHTQYMNHRPTSQLATDPTRTRKEDQAEAQAEARLGRPLKPEERLLVRHLIGKKSPEELMAALK